MIRRSAASRRRAGPVVLLAGGGTGGHLFPGVAVAEALAERVPESRVLIASTGRDGGSHHGSACKIERVDVRSPRRPGGPVGLPTFGARLALALGKSLAVLRDERPSVVVGLGGYGSVAPVMAARLLGVPVLLLEQNAVPGRATRLLSRAAAVTATAFPRLRERGIASRVVETGNPVRRSVLAAHPAHEAMGLAPGLPVLGLVGGSLGARSLNERFAAALPRILHDLRERFGRRSVPGAPATLQIVHGTGSAASATRMRAFYREHGVRACVRPFFDDMGGVYGTCDVLLCRAGGTTVAEVTAVGIATVFVPYPHHADGHQWANARPLVESGAATLVPESELTPAAASAEILPLLLDAAFRRRRARAARRLGRPDAAAGVVDLVLELARDRVSERVTRRAVRRAVRGKGPGVAAARIRGKGVSA